MFTIQKHSIEFRFIFGCWLNVIVKHEWHANKQKMTCLCKSVNDIQNTMSDNYIFMHLRNRAKPITHNLIEYISFNPVWIAFTHMNFIWIRRNVCTNLFRLHWNYHTLMRCRNHNFRQISMGFLQLILHRAAAVNGDAVSFHFVCFLRPLTLLNDCWPWAVPRWPLLMKTMCRRCCCHRAHLRRQRNDGRVVLINLLFVYLVHNSFFFPAIVLLNLSLINEFFRGVVNEWS